MFVFYCWLAAHKPWWSRVSLKMPSKSAHSKLLQAPLSLFLLVQSWQPAANLLQNLLDWIRKINWIVMAGVGSGWACPGVNWIGCHIFITILNLDIFHILLWLLDYKVLKFWWRVHLYIITSISFSPLIFSLEYFYTRSLWTARGCLMSIHSTSFTRLVCHSPSAAAAILFVLHVT